MRWRFHNLRRRVLPGIVSTIAVLLLSLSGLLQPLEELGYQALFMLRGHLPWTEPVVVIGIDDRSLKELGRFPWNRQQYVKLLEVLKPIETSTISFDLIWSESSAEDQALAQAMSDHQSVVLAHAWDNFRFPLKPVNLLRESAATFGHIHKQSDADGISRSIQAQLNQIPAFAIAAVETYSIAHDVGALPPLDRTLNLNWITESQRIPTYSFVDVIRGKIPPKVFENKLVLVGITALGFDPLITPFDRDPPTTSIYLHATLVHNLLNQHLLQPIPKWQSFSFLSLFGLGLSACLERWRTSSQGMIGLGCAIAWFAICVIALKFGTIWLPVAAPILLVLLVVMSSILYERLRLNRILQQQVQDLWTNYYDDLVTRKVDRSQLVTHQLGQQPISMQRASQLAILAEQFGRSHAAQAAIARNLSIGLLAADLDGFIWFSNPIATTWLNAEIGMQLQSRLVPAWIQPEDWTSVLQFQLDPIETKQFGQWFEVRFEPLFYQKKDFAPSGLLLILEDITERKQAAIALQSYADSQVELNQRLELVNQELEAFSYAVSHDLRAPLRRIEGFSSILLETTNLDEESSTYLNRIGKSVKRMKQLIEDLLQLSRIVQTEMNRRSVNLSQLCEAIAQGLQHQYPVDFKVQPNLVVEADERLLKIALENLLGNAWKYTSKTQNPKVECGMLPDSRTFFIRDNGVGFEMKQVDRLFGAFQRLHSQDEFPGTGVGLMTVRRIIHRHQGRIWAEAVINQGATFYFTLTSGVQEKSR